jgi:hypothetical protein
MLFISVMVSISMLISLVLLALNLKTWKKLGILFLSQSEDQEVAGRIVMTPNGPMAVETKRRPVVNDNDSLAARE